MSFSPSILKALAAADACNAFEDPFEAMRICLKQRKAEALYPQAEYALKRKLFLEAEAERELNKKLAKSAAWHEANGHSFSIANAKLKRDLRGIAPSSKMSRPSSFC